MRFATGEARVDGAGLSIRDRDGGWTVRLGNVRMEMLRDAARAEDPFAFDVLRRTDAVWGLHLAVPFG